MLTRREVMWNTLVFASVCQKVRLPEILTEPHLLSKESGAHFREMLDQCVVPRDLMVVPGAREMSAARAATLRSRVESGTWVVLESGLCFATEAQRREQTALWAKAFGLSFSHSQGVSELFVEYGWPVRQIIRGFGVCTVLESTAGAIAYSGGKPVCCRRTIGDGGVIFLGSMLGPGLGAGEREAEDVGRQLLDRRAAVTSVLRPTE